MPSPHPERQRPRMGPFVLFAALLLMVGCAAPKLQYPAQALQPLAVTLPEGFSKPEREAAEAQLLPALEAWPQGTRISIHIQPMAVDPRLSLKDTWSHAIEVGTEGGWNVGSTAGGVVDLILLRAPCFTALVGATGFLVGGIGGVLFGPMQHQEAVEEARRAQDFNFIATMRIEVPGKPATQSYCFDAEHYPVKGPLDPKDPVQQQQKRRESLEGLLRELLKDLRKQGRAMGRR